MLYANRDGEKVLAEPRTEGTCPACDQPLRPKCGEIKIWHWAHISDLGCSAEHEPETDWHRAWKSRFPKENVEVLIGGHRADVVTAGNLVLEFQHSSISVDQIKAREAEYKKMVWVFDAREPWMDSRVRATRSATAAGLDIQISRWRPTIEYCTAPVFLDVDGGWVDMLHVRAFSQRKLTKRERYFPDADNGAEMAAHDVGRYLNWGYGVSYNEFIRGVSNPNKR